MDDNYRQKEGYAHYKSAQFAYEMIFSFRVFQSIVFGYYFRYPRPMGPVNTPADLPDDESTWSSDDGYEGVCGPDEDYYLSMVEGYFVEGDWPFGYWPEGLYGSNRGYTEPRRYK
jgi:hypothetical protein